MGDGGQLRPYEEGLHRQGLRHLAGIDEVGRGCLAGPVVAAAVILPEHHLIPGLRDSKLLAPRRREELDRLIRAEALAVALEAVPESVIDEVNILRATHLAMAGAVARLGLKPDYLLVDGLPVPNLTIPQWAIVGGDRVCASIAAASIVAKVYRDALMVRFHLRWPRYGFDRHKGYGTREHRRALAAFGPCPIHRRTFRGVRELLEQWDGRDGR